MKKYLKIYLFLIITGIGASGYLFLKSKTNLQSKVSDQSDFSSMAESALVSEDINSTNYDYINRLSDQEVLSYLEKAPKFFADEKEHVLASEDIENYYQNVSANLDNWQAGTKSEFSYQQIADDAIKGDFEDVNSCKPNGKTKADRLFYEKQLSNPKLKDLVQRRSEESKLLPMKCITHIMNKFSAGGSSFAFCAKTAGPAKIPGAKPCVTERLVSLTYNSFVDVTECLNLNPKDLLPKIFNESGFFLNTYGAGKDGGVGQLTGVAIEEVNKNKYYDHYIAEMEMAAANKPSCARVMANKALLAKASAAANQRCSLMGLPDNPLKNIVYLSILNRISMDYLSGVTYKAGVDYFQRKDGALEPVKYDSTDLFEGVFQKENYRNKLIQLGIKNPNMHIFKDILTYSGYNMGLPTSIRLFTEYLQKRIAAKKPVSPSDFDFTATRMAVDLDGKNRSVVDAAKLNIMSSFVSPKDSPEVKLMKVKRRKELPKLWATAYLRSFPEFLAYRANEYDGKSISTYKVYGTPGYLNIVSDKNKIIRDVFQNSGIDPNYCSNPNYLKVK